MSGDTTIPNPSIAVVCAKVMNVSSCKNEPAGATKGQAWTRAAAVESAVSLEALHADLQLPGPNHAHGSKLHFKIHGKVCGVTRPLYYQTTITSV